MIIQYRLLIIPEAANILRVLVIHRRSPIILPVMCINARALIVRMVIRAPNGLKVKNKKILVLLIFMNKLDLGFSLTVRERAEVPVGTIR